MFQGILVEGLVNTTGSSGKYLIRLLLIELTWIAWLISISCTVIQNNQSGLSLFIIKNHFSLLVLSEVNSANVLSPPLDTTNLLYMKSILTVANMLMNKKKQYIC